MKAKPLPDAAFETDVVDSACSSPHVALFERPVKIDRVGSHWSGAHDWMLVLLAYRQGMRVSELVALLEFRRRLSELAVPLCLGAQHGPMRFCAVWLQSGGSIRVGTSYPLLQRIRRRSDGPNHLAWAIKWSFSFDQRRWVCEPFTAMASALRVPTSTTRRLPRVTPVYSNWRLSIT